MSTRRRGRRKQKSFWTWLKKLSTRNKILLGVTITLFSLSLAIVVFLASKFAKLQDDDVKKEEIIINDLAEDVGVGYTNIALFGVDARAGINEKGTRTDCIIIASLNNETKEVKLVSVYRDTLLNLSNGSYQKCNAAYSKGAEQQAISMLNMNLDLNIKEYVTVDWSAVIDTVELLGGLEIDVKQDEIAGINEHMISTASATGNKVTPVTKAGIQTLNGVQATTYCRIRSTKGSDFARTERQRYVIEKMFEKALQSDLKTINSIVDKIFPKIKTSLTLTEILGYAKSFSKYKIGETTGFPIEKSTGTIAKKGSCVIPKDLKTNVVMLHEFLFGEEGYEPSSTVLEISDKIQSIVAGSKQNSGGGNNSSNSSNNGGTGSGNEGGTGSGNEGGTGSGNEGGTGSGNEGGTGSGNEGGTGSGNEGGTGTGGEGETGTGTEGETGTGTEG